MGEHLHIYKWTDLAGREHRVDVHTAIDDGETWGGLQRCPICGKGVGD